MKQQERNDLLDEVIRLIKKSWGTSQEYICAEIEKLKSPS